jgi:predicted AlkP superfamily phosphohydrolase/phosphomutase
MATPRTLIIGIDGATFDIVQPWIEAGYLPTLAKLVEAGTHGNLLAWPNMNSAAAWTSMVTGFNPGQHGVFDFGVRAPAGANKFQPISGAMRARRPFWRYLSDAGQRVGVVNLPISYPAEAVNGFMLAGMDTPSVNSPGFAHPPELLSELRRADIDYALDVPKLEGLRKRNPHQVPDRVKRMIDARARAILNLMQEHSWDTLMAVFTVTDRVQHYYWPGEQAAFDSLDWNVIRSVYQQIDAFLAEVLELIDENTTVLIVSDHGFGPARYAARGEVMHQLFERLQLVQLHRGSRSFSNRLLGPLLRQGRKIVPLSLQRPLTSLFPGLYMRTRKASAMSALDMSRSQVFLSPYFGKVYINLQGRQAEGIVLPEDYTALRESIRAILLDLTDADRGQPVVQDVQRREELYHGPYLNQAPDLAIRWDEDWLGESLCYHTDQDQITIRMPEGVRASVKWKGGHRQDGILLAYGPHIQRGATVEDATVYDIAPTILYLQGHPVPNDMDGKVLDGIFMPDHVSGHPPRYADLPTDTSQITEDALDEGDARVIESRLRDLGYIE